MAVVRVQPAAGLSGTVSIPPDKSLTHRAILLGALSDGPVTVEDTLDSEDTAATLSAVESCGVRVEGHLGGSITVHGVGPTGLRPPGRIDCMNAGTLMRLFAGILAGATPTPVVLDGDASLRRRPMHRIAAPLAAMGARVTTVAGGTPPLAIEPPSALVARRHDLAVASAQVKSCILLAGLRADGVTEVTEPVHSRDHTERMLAAAGAPVSVTGLTSRVDGPVDAMRLPDLVVPGDFSSAAFHLVAGALRAAPSLRLVGVNLNPTRAGLLDVMRRMGVRIDVDEHEPAAGEPYGDLVVHRADGLVGTTVEAEEVPALIDEVTLIGILGAFAEGTTVVRGAGELRVKESDRIATTCTALREIGVAVDETEDGFVVHGGGGIRGGRVQAAGDHRIAMLGAVAGLVSVDGVSVDGFEVAAVSYPGFARDLAQIGASV